MRTCRYVSCSASVVAYRTRLLYTRKQFVQEGFGSFPVGRLGSETVSTWLWPGVEHSLCVAILKTDEVRVPVFVLLVLPMAAAKKSGTQGSLDWEPQSVPKTVFFTRLRPF